MSETLTLTPHEHVTVLRSSADALEVEATYLPGGSPPPRHLHPAQDERFVVLSGSILTRVGGTERRLDPGEALDIRRGAVHQLWNPLDAPARVSWTTSPAGRALEWFRTLDALQRDGRVGDSGMPGPLTMAPVLREYRDVFRLAAGPQPLTSAGLAGLAALARLTGRGFVLDGRRSSPAES